MANVRRFTNGASDFIELSSPTNSGFGTIVAVLKRATNATGAVFTIGADAGHYLEFYVEATGPKLWNSFAAAGDTGPFSFQAADGWGVLAMGKATGSVAPRYHKCLLSSGAWTHGDGAAYANWPTGGKIRFGSNLDPGDYLDAFVYAVAYFDAVKLSDVTMETFTSVAAIRAANPTSLWVLDQTTVAVPVSDQVDGANQTSISGTSVAVDTPPNFGIPGNSSDQTVFIVSH